MQRLCTIRGTAQSWAEARKKWRADRAEQRTIDVPVTREEVVIERRPVDRAEGERLGAGELRAGEVIRVPVREEQVTIDKDTVVTEEIEVGKRAVQETKRVSDSVRREEARIGELGTRAIHDLEPSPSRVRGSLAPLLPTTWIAPE